MTRPPKYSPEIIEAALMLMPTKRFPAIRKAIKASFNVTVSDGALNYWKTHPNNPEIYRKRQDLGRIITSLEQSIREYNLLKDDLAIRRQVIKDLRRQRYECMRASTQEAAKADG